MTDVPGTKDLTLLATATKEAFQPARIYYSIPNKAAVTRIFRSLGCVGPEQRGRSWLWLYQDEARALRFGVPYAAVPKELQPIVLGTFRFPDKTRMVLETRSFERAIEAAKFFGPILGSRVVARRARVINRWFDASEVEQGLERLCRLLDANVTVIDPSKTEAEFEQAMAGARTPREKRRAFEAHAEASRSKDVPMVGDFPLAPEEETPDYRDLAITLRFRSLRAYEHWRGNVHLKLADIIEQVVGNGVAAGRIQDVPWPWESA